MYEFSVFLTDKSFPARAAVGFTDARTSESSGFAWPSDPLAKENVLTSKYPCSFKASQRQVEKAWKRGENSMN